MFSKFKIPPVLSVSLLVVVLIVLLTVPVLGKPTVIVQTPPVPAALPFFWMQQRGDIASFADLKIKISPDHKRGLALIAKNEIDMVVTGVNVGAKVYNRGIDIRLMNVNTWGIDYLLTEGFKAEGWRDLRGKTLGLPLKGGPLDFLARYLLQENGVDPAEVDFVYRPLPGAARYFMAGKLEAIILPEPLVTTTLLKNENTRLSLDIQEEWGKLHKGDERIPFVGLFVSGKFARENPQLVKLINGMYMQGIEWINNNPRKTAEIVTHYQDFAIPPEILEASLARVNLNCYSQRESKKLITMYFTEILRMYPEMLGDRRPDEKFYF